MTSPRKRTRLPSFRFSDPYHAPWIDQERQFQLGTVLRGLGGGEEAGEKRLSVFLFLFFSRRRGKDSEAGDRRRESTFRSQNLDLLRKKAGLFPSLPPPSTAHRLFSSSQTFSRCIVKTPALFFLL